QTRSLCLMIVIADNRGRVGCDLQVASTVEALRSIPLLHIYDSEERTLKRGFGQDCLDPNQSQQGVDPKQNQEEICPILPFQSILGPNILHQAQPHFNSKPRPSLPKN
ncbi:hypothetical protein, partial [Klebsiella pneumoniae]|uniref:hypothetical protein n=1 Tax=Klebsiella pneumoniae TaxID=573 RepID=UPI001C5EC37A